MKRPERTDENCRRQGMLDVPVANYSKMQDKYIDYLESKVENLTIQNVSQQRELLKAFLKWKLEHPYSSFETQDYDIDTFLKAFNCG